MKRLTIAVAVLMLTGCASAYPVGDTYTADLREAAAAQPPSQPGFGAVLLGAVADFLIETDPNRHVTTVWVGRERHTVTTTVSRDGRRSTVRVGP